MTDDSLLDRITVNPGIFGGKPIIRGLRIAVEHVLGMLASGASSATILSEYPILEPDDLRACLVYAQRRVAGERSRNASHLPAVEVSSRRLRVFALASVVSH